MPSYFPCPNSQCAYQFDAEILPAAAMVTCPLCRTKFPYRASRPVAAPAGSAPGTEPARDDAKPTGPRVVNLRDVPKDGGPLSMILWIGGSVLVIGTLVAVLVNFSRKRDPVGTRTTEDGAQIDEKFNLKLEQFPAGWEEDGPAREAMQANIFARKRIAPSGWTAMAARDYGSRNPRPAEMDEFIQFRLRKALSAPTVIPIEGETWVGESAHAFKFAGDLDGVQVRGEALGVSYKGFAYFFFAWAGEGDWDGLRGELTGLRNKFKPLKERLDWRPEVGNTTVFAGSNFQLEDSDGAWVQRKPADEFKGKRVDPQLILDDPKEIDPAAKMALLAFYQPKVGGDGKRQRYEAEAVVVELPGGDPIESARANAVERIKKEYVDAADQVKLEPMMSSPANVPLPTGGPTIARFRFQDPLVKTDKYMWIIAGISTGGKVIAVQIKAKEKDATYLEEWMVHLAGSLRSR